ncbi:hypothetical protein WJX77_002641 [Trebouxia sp. C0004]
MAGRFGPNVLVSLVLLLLDLGAFFILLGAASALQHNGSTIAPLLNEMSGALTYGDLTPTTVPRRFISYEWFKAVLQAVILLFALGTFALGQFHRFRISTCCLLAVTTVLFCDAAQTFYYLHIQVDAAEAVTGSAIAKQVRAYWAGCMLTAALNLALIVTIGSGISEARPHDYNSESAAASGKRFGVGNGANPATDSARGGAGTTVV